MFDAMRGEAQSSTSAEVSLRSRKHLDLLFDRPQDVFEYGSTVVPAATDLEGLSDGASVAVGRVHGRPTVAVAYDGSVAGGTHGIRAHAKSERVLELASRYDAPVVLLAEGGGYRAGEPPYCMERRDLVRALTALSGRVPVVGVAVGATYDTRALMLGVCDLVIATANASISLKEPNTDDNSRGAADDANGAEALARAGAVDVILPDDVAAIGAIRHYLGLLSAPQIPFDSSLEDPAVAEGLRSVVPPNARRAIDGRRLTTLVADSGSVLLLRERFGGALQTSVARIGGRSVGIVASHSMIGAGAIDSAASDKYARFLDLCDAFGLPVVQFTDVPGLLAGPDAERSAMNRHSARPFFVQAHAQVPYLSVIMRRAYGQGMMVMGLGPQVATRAVQLFWPTADYGHMGLGGAATITASSGANTSDERSADEIRDELVEHGSAYAMAERFRVDGVIDPGETRQHLISALSLVPDLPSGRIPQRPIDAW